MKKTMILLLSLVLLVSLAAPAFADAEGVSYEMYISRTEKIVYQSGREVGQPISGECNARLYDVIDLPYHDRDLFDTTTLTFVDGDNGLVMTEQTLVGLNGWTYTSSNPEVAFILSSSELLPTGQGEAEIVVCDESGEELDRFTATVGYGNRARRISAPCSQCGKDQGKYLHLLECGHFSCDGNAYGHAKGECSRTGHYNCDGLDHGLCSNCLSWLCSGEHGVGVCTHVHSWFYANSANYWPYQEPGVPMRICTFCGAVEYSYSGYVSSIPPYCPYYPYYPYYPAPPAPGLPAPGPVAPLPPAPVPPAS